MTVAIAPPTATAVIAMPAVTVAKIALTGSAIAGGIMVMPAAIALAIVSTVGMPDITIVIATIVGMPGPIIVTTGVIVTGSTATTISRVGTTVVITGIATGMVIAAGSASSSVNRGFTCG